MKAKGPGERTETMTPAGNPQPTCGKSASTIPANARTPSIPVDAQASPVHVTQVCYIRSE
jgi:hypothetical protein